MIKYGQLSYPKICLTFFYFYLAYVKIICIHGPQFVQLGHAFNMSFIIFCIAQSLGLSSVIMDVIGLSKFSRQTLFGNFLNLFSQIIGGVEHLFIWDSWLLEGVRCLLFDSIAWTLRRKSKLEIQRILHSFIHGNSWYNAYYLRCKLKE